MCMWFRCRTSQLFLALALTILITVNVEGQDLAVEDPEPLGREAFKNGNYDAAEQHLRHALELAETDKTSDTNVVVAIGNLAETLRMKARYDEAEKLLDRALRILKGNDSVDKR